MNGDEKNLGEGHGCCIHDEVQRQLLRDAARLRSYIASKISRGLEDWVTPDDVLQEVWVSVFRGLSKFRPTGPDALARWTTVLADRRLIDAIRVARGRTRKQVGRARHGAGESASSLASMLSDFAIDSHTPSGVVATREATTAVQLALAQLSADHRQAIILFHLHGETVDDIARLMGRTKAAVNGLLFRSRQHLGELLGRMSKYLGEASHV
jgi:RNA polymerase sigma-70 factor (ECF subfamily)